MTSFNHNHRKQPRPELETELTENQTKYVLQKLEKWQAPAVDPTSTARLIDQLAAELPPTAQPSRRRWNKWAQLLLHSQLRLVHAELWIASALVMALGMLVTLASGSSNISTLPFVLVAPLVTAMGVAFIYGVDADPALEIIMATAASQRLLTLARLVLVFGFDLVLALIFSLVLALSGNGLALLPIISAWLVPMLFLSSLAFLLTVVMFDSLFGVITSLALWGAVCVNHIVKLNDVNWILPTLLNGDLYRWLWLPALLFIAFALWLTGIEERGVSRLGRAR